MVMLRYDNEYLSVQRVVIGRDLPSAFQWAIRGLAERLRLAVSPPETTPEPGDYWVGCSPDAGWGDADPHRVGWVSMLDIEAGLAALRSELPIQGV